MTTDHCSRSATAIPKPFPAKGSRGVGRASSKPELRSVGKMKAWFAVETDQVEAGVGERYYAVERGH